MSVTSFLDPFSSSGRVSADHRCDYYDRLMSWSQNSFKRGQYEKAIKQVTFFFTHSRHGCFCPKKQNTKKRKRGHRAPPEPKKRQKKGPSQQDKVKSVKRSLEPFSSYGFDEKEESYCRQLYDTQVDYLNGLSEGTDRP
jgi:hypothetical protein